MRVAVVQNDASGTGNRSSFGEMLSRPVAGLASDIAEYGHDVTLVTLRLGGPRRIGERPLSIEARERRQQELARRAGASGISAVECVSQADLVSTLRELGSDAVLAVGAVIGEALDRAGSALAAPWAWTPMPGDLRPDPQRGGGIRVPRRAARFVVATLAEVDALARLGVARDRCDVVPWQLSANARCNRNVSDVPAAATALITTSDRGGAGVADVIRALGVLPEMRLTVAVDEVCAADVATTDRWVRLAAGLKVATRVRLVRVHTGESLRVLLRSSDLLVSVPHDHLEAPLVSSAMWAGTPTVVSDVDGARELVESGTTGLVLPGGQPRRLARALRVVSRDLPARSSWTWAAERRAVEHLDRLGTALTMSLALETTRHARSRSTAWDGAEAG